MSDNYKFSSVDPYTLRGGNSYHHIEVSPPSHNSGIHSHQNRALYPRRGAIDYTAASQMQTESRRLQPLRIFVDPPPPTRKEIRESRALRSRPDGAHPTPTAEQWYNLPQFVVGRNHDQAPSISFFPHDGVGCGVAMGLAFYQEGMALKQNSIEPCLPHSLRHIMFLPFILRWPGYTHIKSKHTITLIDPDAGRHVTYGRIAQQVSQIFSNFIQHFGHLCDGSDNAIMLGPSAVTFHDLRLQQIYTKDGRSIDAEISYVKK